MKPTRYISLIIALLSVLGIAAQQQQQSQYALYNYRNDGDFNAWLNIDVDSITYSNIGLDSVEYDNIVTQEVWTPDSCYRIPLEAIDSIGFRAPEPIMREGIFYLRDYHAAFTNSIDSLTIYFNNSILNDSLPSVGQPILCATKMTPYEDGFAGKVKAIRNENDKVVVECEMLCVADVYKRLVMAGRAITETEAKENARKRAAGDPWVKYEDSDVIIKDLGDINLKILDGLFFANSIKPTLQVNYFVYVDEDIYDMSATIRLNHNDLEYGVDLNLNKLLAIDDTISADKESKEITQALLRMRNYKNMSQEDWVNSIVEEVKKKGEKEKLDADQAGLMKGMWKEMHKEWEIPIGGPFTLGLEIGPLLDLKGSVDIQGKIKTKARNTIYIEAKGSTTATLASPTIALATGLAKINGYSGFHIEPIQSLSVGINAKGSLDVGFFGKASLNLIHKSVVHASGSIKAGLKLAGNIGYTWDSETWYDEDFSTLFDLDPLYDGMKDTKIKLEAFADLGLEVGITPWKFLTAGAEFELGKADLGSCYLFPHFSQPAFPTYDYKNDQWSNGNYDNHMVLESSPSKNIPDFLLGPCKIGMKIIDKNGVCVKESDEREYRDDGTIYWGLFPLSIDLTGLTPGNTYRCFPVLRYKDWWQLRATPSYEFTMPYPMTLEQDAVVLQKFKTRLVAINGGWGDYSTSTSSRLICTSEIVNNNGKPYVKIATLRSFGSATVTVKDLRSGETKTILVTVSNDAVPEEFTLSEQTVSLQEDESTTVLVTSGSGNYTAESSNENVATATVEDDMITITAISIGSAVITVTDTETEETATIEVTVKEAGGGIDIFEVDLPPSTTLSPEIQWEADIMVFNNGERYNSNYLNQVIGTPPSDTNGNKWYAQNYQLTNSEKTWNVGKSPFSSDATYSGKPSTQWTTDGIMADIYLRRTFTVDHELSDKILFSCCHDDAPAEWYLNGVLIRSIDDGWNYDDKVYLTPEQCALIHTDGTKNVLAIHVHNNWGGAFADGGLYDEGKIPVEIGLPPSTTVSPDVQWKADMMVFNGERYASDVDPLYSYSNQLIGTPPSDAQGNEWYARNYQLTDGEKSWGVGRSPFYSYATYKGKPSTQWTPDWYMADIYLRRYFVVDHELSDKIMFSCSHDDAPAEWYLNGVLIRSIEDGCAHHDEDYDSWTEDESTYLTPEQRALIYTDGRVNVLAIHVHNNWGVGFADGGFYEVTEGKSQKRLDQSIRPVRK